MLKHTLPVALTDVPVALNQDMKALVPQEDVNAPWLARLIKSLQPTVLSWVRATTADNFPIDNLLDLEVELPPFDEQRRIAAILDQAGALRAARSKTSALTADLAQSLFIEVFGDPVRNPHGWPMFSLNDTSESGLSNGAYFPKNAYGPDGVEMVHMSDVFYNQVQRGDLKRVRVSESEIEKYRVTSDDLLIARRSLNYSGAAKPCLVPPSDDPLLFESSLIRFTPNTSKVRARYLFHLLGNGAYRRGVIAKIVTGTTIFGVSQSNLSRIPVPIPPLEVQDRFEQELDQLDKLTDRASLSSLHLDSLSLSLQSCAFAGRL